MLLNLLVFCVMFCRSLFVPLFLLGIVLSVLRFMASDYPLDIGKVFLYSMLHNSGKYDVPINDEINIASKLTL